MVEKRLYAQLTLDYADSHKIAPLSDAAFRAHVSMILWSRRMLTDGKIPAGMALVLAGRKQKVLTELTTNDPDQPSLVIDEHGDYWLHDFLEHQKSRAYVEARQEIGRTNGAKGGQAKAKQTATNLVTEPAGETVADSYTESESESETTSKTSPTRPVPETAKSPTDDDADQSRRNGYWTGWKIQNPARIVAMIASHVSRPVTEDQAIVIIAGLLAKASPKAPIRSVQAYVESSIDQSWAEIQRDLDEAGVVA